MKIESANAAKLLQSVGFPHDVAMELATQYEQQDRMDDLFDYIHTKQSLDWGFDSVPLADR